jgi:hypothetical protein
MQCMPSERKKIVILGNEDPLNAYNMYKNLNCTMKNTRGKLCRRLAKLMCVDLR